MVLALCPEDFLLGRTAPTRDLAIWKFIKYMGELKLLCILKNKKKNTFIFYIGHHFAGGIGCHNVYDKLANGGWLYRKIHCRSTHYYKQVPR